MATGMLVYPCCGAPSLAKPAYTLTPSLARHLNFMQSAYSFSFPPNLDFSHLVQPEPVAFPRKALDQRFAVLLLRSTYDAVDALDFIAMVLESVLLLTLERSQSFAQVQSNLISTMNRDVSMLDRRISFRYSFGKPDRQNMSPTCCNTAQSECGRQALTFLLPAVCAQLQLINCMMLQPDGEPYYRVT